MAVAKDKELSRKQQAAFEATAALSRPLMGAASTLRKKEVKVVKLDIPLRVAVIVNLSAR